MHYTFLETPAKTEQAMNIKWFIILNSEYHSSLFSTHLYGSLYIYVIVSGHYI